MNHNECKEIVNDVLKELQALPKLTSDEMVLAVYRMQQLLCVGKLQTVLEGWPKPSDEEVRLMQFEKDARNVLGTPYGIERATWNHSDGSPGMLRILDDEQVMKLLSH